MSANIVLSELTGFAGLNALVSSRIYRGRFPQGVTYPAILFRAIRNPENTLSGESNIAQHDYTFECYADDYTELQNIITQLKAALAASTTFKAICEAEADDDYQDETGMYSVFLDYSIWL